MTGITIPLAALAGVASFISPCFLPIVPIFLAYLVGGTPAPAHAVSAPAAVGARSGSESTVAGGGGRNAANNGAMPAGKVAARRFAAAHASAFIVGFTVVFVALWASIGLVGYLLGDHRDLLRIAGGAVLIVLGLHVAGLIRIPVLYRRVGASVRHGNGAGGNGAGGNEPSLVRSTVMGLAFGAGWTPCIGPILGGVLGLASTSGSVGEGTILLVAFSMGLGVPFLLVALGATAMSHKLAWFTRHHAALALVNGAMLTLIGFLMITNLFGRLAGLIPALGL